MKDAGHGLDKLLQDFTFKADRISHALSHFTEEAGETEVRVDAEWSWGLDEDEAEAARPALRETPFELTLVEPQPRPVQDEGFASRYLKEVELRDVVIARQAEDAGELRSQLDRHQEVIRDLQREIAEVRNKLSRIDATHRAQQSHPPGSEPPPRAVAPPTVHSTPQGAAYSPRPATLPADGVLAHGPALSRTRGAPPHGPAPQLPAQRFIPAAMAPEDAPVRPQSLRPYGAEPPEEDAEGTDEPQDIREILRKGGGAKLYDI